MSMPDREWLEKGLHAFHAVHLAPALMTYLSLLDKWNHVYNLTAIRDWHEQVEKHLFDSLAVIPFIQGAHVLDVGSGAGLPGIPLALFFPQYSFTLLDSVGKKTQFLEQVKQTLALSHVTIVNARVETYQAPAFDTIIARAFSAIQPFVQQTHHLLKPTGQWLMMKGQMPDAELQGLQYPYQLEAYQVPGLAAARCVVRVQNKER